ncbi:translocator protein homolog [Rhododendron vialii]|uniref:translocator protein homolog n=1 Tax=Rhododendron vialii TaxID=182163 RepID=UPI00265DF347|nr:translocator protein homolog [Rhododendron vialii]
MDPENTGSNPLDSIIGKLYVFRLETENIRQRGTRGEPTVDEPKTNENYENSTKTSEDQSGSKTKGRRPRRIATARRGLRSLAIAVALPLSLHLAAVVFLHVASAKHPTWFRSLALEAVFVGLPALMGFCAWLFWVDGGFHRRPMALAFFLSYLALSLAWDPIVFGLGAPWVGLVVSWAMLGALIACHMIFKEANPIAGDLVAASMIWAVFVICLNLKLLLW